MTFGQVAPQYTAQQLTQGYTARRRESCEIQNDSAF